MRPIFHKSLNDNILRTTSFIALISAGYYASLIRPLTLILAGMAGLLVLMYTLPIRPNSSNMRNTYGWKIFLVAVCWAIVTVLLPIANKGSDTMDLAAVSWAFAQRVVLVLVLTLPFEIRDMKVDPTSLGTVPQRLGIIKTKWLGTVLMLLWFGSHLLLGLTVRDKILMAGICSLAILSLICAYEHQSNFYSSFWVEAIPMVWLTLYLFWS